MTQFYVAVVGADWREQLFRFYFGGGHGDENPEGMWDSMEVSTGWFPFKPGASDRVDRSQLDRYAFPGPPTSRVVSASILDQAVVSDLEYPAVLIGLRRHGLITGGQWLHPPGEHPGLRPTGRQAHSSHTWNVPIERELRSLTTEELVTGFYCHK